MKYFYLATNSVLQFSKNPKSLKKKNLRNRISLYILYNFHHQGSSLKVKWYTVLRVKLESFNKCIWKYSVTKADYWKMKYSWICLDDQPNVGYIFLKSIWKGLFLIQHLIWDCDNLYSPNVINRFSKIKYCPIRLDA